MIDERPATVDRAWRIEDYDASLTSRAWTSTPYDWSARRSQAISGILSSEIKAIFEEELAIGAVPAWARAVVERMIAPLPMCGHYSFPRPLLQICTAIGREGCPKFVVGCYTADTNRKLLLSYYVYCLDTWLKRAPLGVAMAELAQRDPLGRDWPAIVASIYRTLGTSSQIKIMLLKRLLHRLRWWIKALIWDNDRRDRFMLDVYAGDIRGDESRWGAYGNSPFGDPYFTERELPEIKDLAEQIRQCVPNGIRLLSLIEDTWLCGPKAFRWLEKLISAIGNLDAPGIFQDDRPILRCEDTYPDFASYRRWYLGFMDSLTEWLKGDAEARLELGESTPVKRWLVHMLQHKLQLYQAQGNFGKLVGELPTGRSGRKALDVVS